MNDNEYIILPDHNWINRLKSITLEIIEHITQIILQSNCGCNWCCDTLAEAIKEYEGNGTDTNFIFYDDYID